MAVQWLPDGATQRHLIEALRENVLALASFVQRTVDAYLKGRPNGMFTVEDS